MEPITVSKGDLLAKMRENRATHREVFQAALEGYRRYAQLVLKEHLEALGAGKTPEIRITVSRPSDHTRDYDRVIEMLEMHKGDEFVLNETDFSQYVRDDWSWKRQWATSNSSYAVAQVSKAYGEYLDD